MKKIHLIAIGGAIMHNLAISLARKGYTITGSDDAIYDPAKSNLEKEGLLPKTGWDANAITSDIDIIILGMHAREDNVELLKAKKLGLKIMSFPEFVAEECKDKKRVVVAGSHGKTTTTSILMHVLSQLNIEFDYLVGSSVDGFDLSVKLTDAPLILIEGDEYLSSPIDRRSKFLWYNPHISIITGIAYDHINVFPTFESYIETFKLFIETHEQNGIYFWYKNDPILEKLAQDTKVNNRSYVAANHSVSNGRVTIHHNNEDCEIEMIGEHNLENIEAAAMVCSELNIARKDFYRAVSNFTGAGKRMEKIFESDEQVVFRDFAHSPSKLSATTNAVKKSYNNGLTAVFELHTFSSLNKEFLPLYKGSMNEADRAIVFFNDEVFKHRKMEVLGKDFVKKCFGNVEVVNQVKILEELVFAEFELGRNILLMSSGKFENAKFIFS